MSAVASAAAWEHGDYRGARFVVLLALADVANDAHENELWMRHGNLARKARCDATTAREAIHTFVADGWLEVLDEPKGRNPGRYRFVGPPILSGVGPDNADGLSGVSPDVVGGGARQAAAAPLSRTKEELPGSATGSAAEADRIVREWWESHDPRPLGSFPGCRKIVKEAIDRGHRADRVAVALRRCGNVVPSKPVLARELDRGGPRSERPPDRPEGYDQRAPDEGRSW